MFKVDNNEGVGDFHEYLDNIHKRTGLNVDSIKNWWNAYYEEGITSGNSRKEEHWDAVKSFITKSGLAENIGINDTAVIVLIQRLVDLEKFLERLGIEI